MVGKIRNSHGCVDMGREISNADIWSFIWIGELRLKAAEVNEEAKEVLDTMVQAYLRKHKPKNPDSTMEMWRLREQARAEASEFILEDIVCRFH